MLRGFRRLELNLDPVNVTPPVSAYQAAVNYEIGLIAAKVDRPDRPARLVRRGVQRQGRSGPAPARRSTVRLPRRSSSRRSRASRGAGPVELPTSIAEPAVTTADLAGARASAARALSAPVSLDARRRGGSC